MSKREITAHSWELDSTKPFNLLTMPPRNIFFWIGMCGGKFLYLNYAKWLVLIFCLWEVTKLDLGGWATGYPGKCLVFSQFPHISARIVPSNRLKLPPESFHKHSFLQRIQPQACMWLQYQETISLHFWLKNFPRISVWDRCESIPLYIMVLDGYECRDSYWNSICSWKRRLLLPTVHDRCWPYCIPSLCWQNHHYS